MTQCISCQFCLINNSQIGLHKALRSEVGEWESGKAGGRRSEVRGRKSRRTGEGRRTILVDRYRFSRFPHFPRVSLKHHALLFTYLSEVSGQPRTHTERHRHEKDQPLTLHFVRVRQCVSVAIHSLIHRLTQIKGWGQIRVTVSTPPG